MILRNVASFIKTKEKTLKYKLTCIVLDCICHLKRYAIPKKNSRKINFILNCLCYVNTYFIIHKNSIKKPWIEEKIYKSYLSDVGLSLSCHLKE